MLLFIDESGQDHKDMPCEVLAGVAVAEKDLWNLVKAIRSAEREHFGDYLRNLRITEVKAKRLLKRKTFRLADQSVEISPEELGTLANSFLKKGLDAHESGCKTSVFTAREATAYARSVLKFVDSVLDIAANHNARIFASVVGADTARSSKDILEKDFVRLFERYFYFLKDFDDRERGLVVFDELEKTKAQSTETRTTDGLVFSRNSCRKIPEFSHYSRAILRPF